jgi:hypothetical protein
MADRLSCPSAHPEHNATTVIGVVNKRDGVARVSMLPKAVSLEAVAGLIPESVPITEVLRLGGACVEQRCANFETGRCTLAGRIVARLPAVEERLFPCSLRPSCVWWRQEGAAACQRCPQIVTEPFKASAMMREVGAPPATPRPAKLESQSA